MSQTQYELNKGLAQMLKGGVIMDVTTPEQAKIAEAAGACAVMALERIPADIRAAGGVSRMSDPKMIKGIQEAVSIPVMAKCRIGHFVEAQILEAIEIDYIDESEVLSPADDIYHIDKQKFKVPFVCGARDLGEALRRINEGASMIRTKGEPGTGDVVQAVRHMRKMNSEIRKITAMSKDELYEEAKQLQVPFDLILYVHENGKLPVVNFAAGGVATPADAALMMQLGAEGVFVGSGIFKSGDPAKRAAAIVQAVTNYKDAKLIAKLSEDLGEAMVGINPSEIKIIMEDEGYQLAANSRFSHSLDAFHYQYLNSGGNRDMIKIELNYSLRAHIFEPVYRPILTDAFDGTMDLLTVHPLEIFAAKANALLSRAAARDLYDVNNLVTSNLFEGERDLLRKAIVFYATISAETINRHLSIIIIIRPL